MFAHWWHHPQITRLQARFAARPRHPLLRLAAAVVGVVFLGFLLLAGVFIGAAMLLASTLLRLVRPAHKPHRAGGRIIEGEFRTRHRDSLPQAR